MARISATAFALRTLVGAFCIALLVPSLVSCGNDKKETLDLTIDPENTPTMLTHNVSTLISDSGITRYHITAPIWYMFGESKQPRWTFPEGVFLEKFDDDLKQEATVECDSATYFEARHLWRLDGNVRIRNIQNEKFLTEQLFWDQRQQKVYSDSFIHIERQDRVIEGYGFTSDDRLTDYVVHRVSGIFPVSQFAPGAAGGEVDSREPSGRPGTSPARQTESVNTTAASDSSAQRTHSPTRPGTVMADSTGAKRRQAMKMRRERHQQKVDSARRSQQ